MHFIWHSYLQCSRIMLLKCTSDGFYFKALNRNSGSSFLALHFSKSPLKCPWVPGKCHQTPCELLFMTTSLSCNQNDLACLASDSGTWFHLLLIFSTNIFNYNLFLQSIITVSILKNQKKNFIRHTRNCKHVSLEFNVLSWPSIYDITWPKLNSVNSVMTLAWLTIVSSEVHCLRNVLSLLVKWRKSWDSWFKEYIHWSTIYTNTCQRPQKKGCGCYIKFITIYNFLEDQ